MFQNPLPARLQYITDASNICNRVAETCWLNGMQRSISYSLKFVLMFKYFCDRFFSKKNQKGKWKGKICHNCLRREWSPLWAPRRQRRAFIWLAAPSTPVSSTSSPAYHAAHLRSSVRQCSPSGTEESSRLASQPKTFCFLLVTLAYLGSWSCGVGIWQPLCSEAQP